MVVPMSFTSAADQMLDKETSPVVTKLPDLKWYIL